MITTTKRKIRRADLGPNEIPCDHCTAKCCRYFALPIDTPKTWEDFDHLRWYSLHVRISFFVEDGTWYLMVHADCKHIQSDQMCGIYEDRPQICRTYSADDCEFDDDATYEKFFETPEQVWEYAQAVLPPKRKDRANRAITLPVLSASV